MDQKSLVIALIAGILIFIRIIAETSEWLAYIVGGINVIAIIYVLYTIMQRTKEGYFEKIEERDISTQFKVEKKKRSSLIFRVLSIGMIILAILYFHFACSSRGNDILSIIALTLSLIDDEIVLTFLNMFN